MRVAFVVQRYGLEVNGGAELLCRKVVEHLAPEFAVEVLTTCARHFRSDWGKDYHRPGVYRVNDVVVRRFSLRPRDRQLFHAVNLRARAESRETI